ncbi:MAG: transcription termination/antitermination protein NusG, partial [Actinomycetota bacterium]
MIDETEHGPAEEKLPESPTVDPALEAEVEDALESADDPEIDDTDDLEWLPGDWYVIQTYSGYENKVKADLEHRIAAMHLEEQIYEVIIPTEQVQEIKGGKKTKIDRKVFPGYLLVRCDLDDEAWIAVRNTPGVTGFVGGASNTHRPLPLTKREVERILSRGKEEEAAPGTTAAPVVKRSIWSENDPVRVTAGPFANFHGVIAEVDDEREKVRVLVNIFGRETPVELSFD